MNTRKQVLIMSGLLLVMLVVIAIYGAWYPSRATNSEASFEDATAERGAILFARNCRLCHGDQAEGGALGGRLPAAPALNRPDLQGFDDSGATISAELGLTTTNVDVDDASKFKVDDVILIDEERMHVKAIDGNTLTVERAVEHTEAAGHFPGAKVYLFKQSSLDDKIKLITNTITCGRVGTAMPAWGESQGGPLSDEQIRQLMTLITQARWDLVAKEVAIDDAIDSHLTAPVAADATEISVSDITRFNVNDAIRLGDERLRITAIPDHDPTATKIPGNLTVDRGIHNTVATDHPEDTQIFKFPEVAEPQINASSCGQTAAAPVASGPCPVTDGKVEISAQNISYSCSDITVDSGGQVTVAFTNKEATPHNFAVYKSKDDLTPVAPTSVGNVFGGPDVTQEITFDAPAPGTYFYRCDVHPAQMNGTFTVK
jgi:plastocyanin